jgi:hypothetical protein
VAFTGRPQANGKQAAAMNYTPHCTKQCSKYGRILGGGHRHYYRFWVEKRFYYEK